MVDCRVFVFLYFFPPQNSFCYMAHIPPEKLHSTMFASVMKCVRRINATAQHSISPFSSQTLTFDQFGRRKILPF